MSLLDEIKSKADANGDGKLSQEDIEGLQGSIPQDKFDQLKSIADGNADGKIDISDVQNLDWGGLLEEAKNTFGNFFGK